MSKVHAIYLPDNADGPGVYFLMQDDQVLYVGQSTSVCQRIINHKIAGKIRFSHALWFEVPESDLIGVEYYWICLLRPRYNNEPRHRVHLEISKWASDLLTPELMQSIEDIETEIAGELASISQQIFANAYEPKHQTLALDISALRQRLFDRMRELELPIPAAHKLIERFFGWNACSTSCHPNGERQPTEKLRLASRGETRLLPPPFDLSRQKSENAQEPNS